MALLERFRRRQVPIARSVAILFAASWLGLAVQPCMAGAADAGAGHGAHAAHQDVPAPPRHAGHDCPHCPPVPSTGHDCGQGVALDCDAIGVPVLPSKDSKAPDWHPAILDLGPSIEVDHAAGPARVDDARRVAWRTPDRPLQQRFCSYLK